MIGSPSADGGKKKPLPASEATGLGSIELLDDLLKELSDDAHEAAMEAAAAGGEGEPAAGEDPGLAAEVPSSALPREGPGLSEAGAPAADQEDSRELQIARAEADALRVALAQQQQLERELRQDLARAREKQEGLEQQLLQTRGRFLPAVPVAFVAPDGRSIARKAFYAVGREEALEQLLTRLTKAWEATGFPLTVRHGPEGTSLILEGDPSERWIRILPSGIHLVHLSPEELSGLGELPSLVRAAAAGSSGQP